VTPRCTNLYSVISHKTEIFLIKFIIYNDEQLENALQYVEIKCQLDATEVFIADLIACSTCFGHHYVHHQELKSIIQWLLPVVFRAVVFKLLVWCGAEGCVSGLQDAAAYCSSPLLIVKRVQPVHRETSEL